MKITIEEIKTRVYDLLDENREIVEDLTEYCEPGAQLGPLIEALLPEAARRVLTEVPLESVDDCRHLDSDGLEASGVEMKIGPGVKGNASAEIRLPSDFLRLVYFRMSDWEEGVTRAIDYNSDSFRLRLRRAASGRYVSTRPAVALRARGARKQLLVYGSSSGGRPAELDYIAAPAISGGCIELPPALVHTVCEKLTGMVKAILGR